MSPNHERSRELEIIEKLNEEYSRTNSILYKLTSEKLEETNRSTTKLFVEKQIQAAKIDLINYLSEDNSTPSVLEEHNHLKRWKVWLEILNIIKSM